MLLIFYFWPSDSYFTNTTSLTASDLLILAGLTITFYSLLNTRITDVMIPKQYYEEFLGQTEHLTNLNIVLVSVSIILILFSTALVSPYSTNFKNTGFAILLLSWILNLLIMLTLTISGPIRKYVQGHRRIFLRIYVVVLTILVILVIYYSVKLFLVPFIK
jgi:hypothetical protein